MSTGGSDWGQWGQPAGSGPPGWWTDPSAPIQDTTRPGPTRQPSPQGPHPQYPPGWQQPPGYGSRPQPTRSGMAVVAAVLGFLGIIVAAIPLGIVALRRIRRYQQTGAGLAVTGLALSAAWLVGFAIVGGVAHLGVSGNQDVAVTSLTRGDCVKTLDKGAVRALSPTSTVTVVPCDTGHVAQVYGTPDLGSTYPGDAALDVLAAGRCAQAGNEHLDDSVLGFLTNTRAAFTAETKSEWSEYDDAVCFVIFSNTQTDSVVS